LESIAIISAGSSSESPSGDSSSDSITLCAFDYLPLDGKAIDLLFLADSCSLRLNVTPYLFIRLFREV